MSLTCEPNHHASPIDLAPILERRAVVAQGYHNMLSLTGLVLISQQLGIAPAGHHSITNENVADWIQAASSALSNNFAVEAYSAVVQGELAISKGEAPSFSRDAARFPASEVYLSSLKVILRILDRQEVEASRGTKDLPYIFDESAWTAEWKTAVDLAVLLRNSICSQLDQQEIYIAPTSNTESIPLAWDDSRVAANILDTQGTTLVSLKGAVVASINFDQDHPWWQASGPMIRKPFDFNKILSIATTNIKNPFNVLHTRTTKSDTLEGTLLSVDKYPDLSAATVTLHFIVQPLPLLASEERVLFAPIIPLPKGKIFVDTVTASQVVIERVLAELESEGKGAIVVQDHQNIHPFEAIPNSNLGTWRKDLATQTSPWIDNNAIVAVKDVMAGKDADFLRDLLRRGFTKLSKEQKNELVGYCLAERNTSDDLHFIQLLKDRDLISDDDSSAIQAKADEIRSKPKLGSALGDLLSMKGFDYGLDSPTMRGGLTRGGHFGMLSTGAAHDVNLGTSKQYSGPSVDCDPMGNVNVYVIMPVAVDEKSDPLNIAKAWLKAFENAALGN